MAGILRVKNWAKHQHYKDRSPPWIKLHTDTFQDYDFSRLQDASKLLAICTWTLAARSKDGSVPDDFGYLKAQCSIGSLVKQEHLTELIQRGFIERYQDASNALADRKQDACSETETETETEGEGEERQRRSISNGFAEFWSAYPRKVAKGPAEKNWKRERPPLDLVLAAIAWQRDSEPWTKDGGKFIPHPSTYLNQRRWEDEKPEDPGVIADRARTAMIHQQIRESEERKRNGRG